MDVIALHLGWYENGKDGKPPDDRDRKDWRKHILKAAKNMLDDMQRVNNKTVGVFREYAQRIIEWAEGGGLGPPPPAPSY